MQIKTLSLINLSPVNYAKPKPCNVILTDIFFKCQTKYINSFLINVANTLYLIYNNIMFNIVLVEPEIPQNTGNIVRTCHATGCRLHLVRPLGFEVSDRYLKRAGLDYWDEVEIFYYDGFDEVLKANPDARFYFFTTKALKTHCDAQLAAGDFLVFGKETKGLDENLLKSHIQSCLRIPMIGETRSLNLSNSVAVAVYEGLRQNGFKGFKTEGRLHNLNWD